MLKVLQITFFLSEQTRLENEKCFFCFWLSVHFYKNLIFFLSNLLIADVGTSIFVCLFL